MCKKKYIYLENIRLSGTHRTLQLGDDHFVTSPYDGLIGNKVKVVRTLKT